MSTRYYSEYGEDEWIDAHLPLPARGVYLDLGCGHPERDSNTAFLRDRGWLGLAVDGNADYAPHWVGRQQFVHAVLSPQARVQFLDIPENSAMGRIVEQGGTSQPAVRLDYLLGCTFRSASPPIEHIDFLSIDLEGHEFEVFQTMDWANWAPGIIVAEYATLQMEGGVSEDMRLRELLVGSGLYHQVHHTRANLIFQRR